MSNKGDGIGTIFINNKNYKGLKVGTSSVKRKYNIPDENGYTVLKIKCSTGSNILNIFNQLTSNVESVEIFNESNVNINTNTILPNLNMDNGSINQYTTWTLPNGNYKVFIKGEFSIKDSTCEILKVKFQNNLTTGYKMFYNCNIVKANLDYGIKIPDSMTNTESMFENSNIDHTAEINLLTATRCSAMYKNCTNLKKIHINYIEAFDNEDTLCPNLSESDYNECFVDCENIRCSNLNSDTNNKPVIFLWDNIPYSWGGPERINIFEIEANDTNGLTLTLVQHLFKIINDDGLITYTAEPLSRTDWGDGTIDNELSHTYSESGTYIVKTKLQPNNAESGDYSELIKKVINVRNDISNFACFCAGCTNMEQFNIDNTIHPTDMTSMFIECSSLTSIDMRKFDTTNNISLSLLFCECTSLNTIIGLENLNVENVDNMIYTFSQTLITNADLSKWNCKNIVNINGLFDSCYRLRSVDLTDWDISKVDSLNLLFNECYELTSIKGIEDWDTSNVINMSFTFRELRALKTLDLSKWNVSKVETMENMFDGCSSLETVGDLSNWTTPALGNAECMFNNAHKIKSLKLTNFDTSNLIYATNMFNNCNGLEEYDIVITFGNNDYTPFRKSPFNDLPFAISIKYITIKGIPDIDRMTSFVDILKDQTATGAILDISQLSSEIKRNLMADTTLVNNAEAKGWTFRQYSLDDLEHFNIFEIEANDTNGMSLTLYENPDKIGEATTYATDWGDGTVDNNTSHTYSATGTYAIKTKLQSTGTTTGTTPDNNNIIKCLNIRNDITNMKNFFRNFKALTNCCNIPDGITDTSYAFYKCSSFNQEINIPNRVTNIRYMFYGCTNFNQPVVIPESVIEMECLFYDCTSFNQTVTIPNSVENINYTFKGCTALNQPITIGSNVIYMIETFSRCSNFNQPVIIPNKVENMDSTFASCVKFNQPIDIPDSVTNINDIFSYCTSLNQPVNIGNSVVYMNNAFNCCSAFNQPVIIPDTVKSIYYAFYRCTSFDQKIIIPNSVQNCSNMFEGCTSLTSIVSNWNNEYTNTIDSENCYKGCNAIQYINDEYIISEWTPSGEGLDEVPLDWGGNGYNKEITTVFKISITSENTEVSPITAISHLVNVYSNEADRIKWGDNSSTIINDTSDSSLWTHSYSSIGDYYIKGTFMAGIGYVPKQSLKDTLVRVEQLVSNGNLQFAFDGCTKLNYVNIINLKNLKIANLSAAFRGCNSLIEINGINSLDISNCKDIANVFNNCKSLTELNISSWDTSSVTSMEGTFYNCENLTSLESINNWNVSNVLRMDGTFKNCNKLLSLNLSSWRTDSLEKMPNIFEGCSSLTELNITNWNTSNVTDLKYAFYRCSALTSIAGIETLNLSNAITMPYLFEECTNLQSVNLSSWGVTNKCTDIRQMFNGCNNITSINLSGWDTSNNTSLHCMFNECNKLNEIIGFSNLDLSSAVSMFGIFKNCSSLTSITFPESFYNDNVCTNVNSAFLGCTKLESINNFNYSKHSTFMGSEPQYISSLFEKCYALTTINDVCLDYTSVLGTVHGGNPINSSFWSNLAFHIFNKNSNLSLKNLTNIKFSGNVTVYDQIDSYQFLEWTWTDKFTDSTWNSFENTFPDLYLTYENPNKQVALGENANPPEDVLYNFGLKGWRAAISSANKLRKYGGNISSTWLLEFINGLTSPFTIDISYGVTDENTIEIISNNEIMNAVSSGGHTLIHKNVDFIDSSYNYFTVNTNDTNGMSLTLYENPDKTGESTTYTTDWGDGTIDNNTSHTYLTDGTYTIKTKLQSSSSSSENYNITKCLNIRNDITDMYGFFYNFASLTEIPELPIGITSLRDTFFGCNSFNQQVNIPSTVTLMNGTFFECESFNQPVVIPDGVETLNGTLYGCTNFNSSINFGSGVKTLISTLQGCTSFNQSVTIPNDVTDILYLFNGCELFNQPVVIPDTVTSVEGLLKDCTNFNNTITFGNSVEDISNLFNGCTSFNQEITIPNSVINYSEAFSNCTSYSSTITFDVLSDSNPTLSNIFVNSTVNNIKFTGELSNTLMTNMLNELVNPTTIDIRELSETNVDSIFNDSGIMNTINTGIGGTSHTLKEKLVEVIYPSFNEWTNRNVAGVEIAYLKDFKATGIRSLDDTPYCEFSANEDGEGGKLITGQKYRFVADLIEGDNFYLQVDSNIYLNDAENLEFTNNSLEFIANEDYIALAIIAKDNKYPFTINIKNLTLYKVIES